MADSLSTCLGAPEQLSGKLGYPGILSVIPDRFAGCHQADRPQYAS